MTFICRVDSHVLSTSAVRAFHYMTTTKMKVFWWVLEWEPKISRREVLLSIILVLHIGSLQVALRCISWGICKICTLYSTVNSASLLCPSKLSSEVICSVCSSSWFFCCLWFLCDGWKRVSPRRRPARFYTISNKLKWQQSLDIQLKGIYSLTCLILGL